MEKAQQIVQVVQEYMSGDRTLDRLCMAAFDCILVNRDLPKCSTCTPQHPTQDPKEFIFAVEEAFAYILDPLSPVSCMDNVLALDICMAVRMKLQDNVLYSCIGLTLPGPLRVTEKTNRQTLEPASCWKRWHPIKEPGAYYQDIRNVGWVPAPYNHDRTVRDYSGMLTTIEKYWCSPSDVTRICDTVFTLADIWYMPGLHTKRPATQQNVSGDSSGLIASLEGKLKQIVVVLSEGRQLDAEPIIVDILEEMNASPLGIVFPADMPVSIGQADPPSDTQLTARQHQDMRQVIQTYYRGSRSFDQLCDTYFKLVEIHFIADYSSMFGRSVVGQITGQEISPLRRDIESGFDTILTLLGDDPVLSSDVYRVLYEVFCAIRDSPVAVTIPAHLPVELFTRRQFAEVNGQFNLEEVATCDVNQQPDQFDVEVPVKVEPESPRTLDNTTASISAERRRVARILLEAYLEVCCPLEG